MKKIIYLLITVLALSSLTACSDKKESAPAQSEVKQELSAENEESRSVHIQELGLMYVTPAQWVDYQVSSIYPETIQSEYTVARIIYNYITLEGQEVFSKADADDTSIVLEDYLVPICEIAVAESKLFDSYKLRYLKNEYENGTEVSARGDYSYYLFSNATDKTNLTAKDEEIYSLLASEENMAELEESFMTREFDPDDVKTLAESLGLNEHITFSTQTLEGKKITSQCFGDYDVTLINFWGTYALENCNEQADLQAVYDHYKKQGNVQVINAVIDTPAAEAEKLALELKKEAGGKFTSIMLDELLANWVTTNLEGVPTTILVDSEGKIVSDQIKGAKGADFYIKAIDKYLE